MNSSRVKLTTFVECHAFCEKFRALELQTLLCLHLNVLLYVTYYCMITHIMSLLCWFLLGLIILLSERLPILQPSGVVWDVLCSCVPRPGAAICLGSPFAFRGPCDSASRDVLVVSWLAVAAGSVRRPAAGSSGSCAWIGASRAAEPGSSALPSPGAVRTGCGGPRWRLAGLSLSKSLFPILKFVLLHRISSVFPLLSRYLY